ncbi:MAG: aromatic-ring-hydroxylating dioxygenase subunit beta [Candidatus Binatia bacterium]|nr:aromatic-ring-hydroxylating dioxygenase subunit beta [Candidatus Binatia bacterium]
MERDTLKAQAEELLYRYAAAIDDGELSQWPEFFVAEGVYKLIPRENYQRGLPVCLIYCKNRAMMVDRVTAILQANQYSPHVYRHHYSNLRLTAVSPDEVTLVANYVVHRTHEEGDTIVFSTGRIIARMTRTAEPRFIEKVVIYDTCRIPDLLVFPI